MPSVTRVTASPVSSPLEPPLLREGARGPWVTRLQARLTELGFSPGAADGAFGPRTKRAVLAFQRAQVQPLQADGVVGPKTWAALEDPAAGEGTPVQGFVRGKATALRVAEIGNGKRLRVDAAAAFNRMHAAAKLDGVTLTPVSGFRTMAEQTALWNRYVRGEGNLAARPGYSNHQGGIAVDISVGSTQSAAYRWLDLHAQEHGFVRTVSSEPWHWEYRP